MTPDLLPPRMAAKVVVDEHGCWLWQGAKTGAGYGMASVTGMAIGRPAHRIAYIALIGPIPSEHDLDHLCRVRGCINPNHLEPVTRIENLRRARTP